jgi:hypothetical protein
MSKPRDATSHVWTEREARAWLREHRAECVETACDQVHRLVAFAHDHIAAPEIAALRSPDPADA